VGTNIETTGTMEIVPQADQQVSGGRYANQILARLTPSELALLEPYLVPVSFAVDDVIARARDPIETICFLEDGIAGILDALEGDRRYAIGLVGNEGFIGWPLLLGDDRSPWDVVMRAERGRAFRLPAEVLLSAIDTSPTLRMTCHRFVQTFMLQMSRTIVSALAHSIERRMARWILLYHDRVREDDICMTHEEFRLMLGVRRSSVTDALHRLEDEQAIQSLRGRVVVRDRAKLMLLAADTYGFAEDEYQRLLRSE